MGRARGGPTCRDGEAEEEGESTGASGSTEVLGPCFAGPPIASASSVTLPPAAQAQRRSQSMVGDRDRDRERDGDGPVVNWAIGEPPPLPPPDDAAAFASHATPSIKEVRYAPFPPPSTPPLPPPLPLQIQQQRPYSRYNNIYILGCNHQNISCGKLLFVY